MRGIESSWHLLLSSHCLDISLCVFSVIAETKVITTFFSFFFCRQNLLSYRLLFVCFLSCVPKEGTDLTAYIGSLWPRSLPSCCVSWYIVNLVIGTSLDLPAALNHELVFMYWTMPCSVNRFTRVWLFYHSSNHRAVHVQYIFVFFLLLLSMCIFKWFQFACSIKTYMYKLCIFLFHPLFLNVCPYVFLFFASFSLFKRFCFMCRN